MDLDKTSRIYIGLDVHKEQTAAAIANLAPRAKSAVKEVSSLGSPLSRCCYAASPRLRVSPCPNSTSVTKPAQAACGSPANCFNRRCPAPSSLRPLTPLQSTRPGQDRQKGRHQTRPPPVRQRTHRRIHPQPLPCPRRCCRRPPPRKKRHDLLAFFISSFGYGLNLRPAPSFFHPSMIFSQSFARESSEATMDFRIDSGQFGFISKKTDCRDRASHKWVTDPFR